MIFYKAIITKYKYFFLIALTFGVLSLTAFKTNHEVSGFIKLSNIINAPVQLNDTLKMKPWLIEVIEDYCDHVGNKDLKHGLTKDYKSYKEEAMNLEFSSNPIADSKAFIKKWSFKYNIGAVGKHSGFFVSSQDPGKIRVKSCVFQRYNAPNSYWYKTLIEDITFKRKYKRDIQVIVVNKKFMINDVVEYN